MPGVSAKLGCTSPELCGLLISLQGFFDARDSVLTDLMGGDYGPSRLREDLMRRVVIEFCQGHILRVKDYQELMKNHGSRNSFRADLKLLECVGVLVIKSGDTDRREKLVWPSARMVSWYETKMSQLAHNAVAQVENVYATTR